MLQRNGRAEAEFSGVAIVGAACRLPGARDEAAFWQLLEAGRCAVGELPQDRWSAQKYFHPRKSEPGFSYSFSGGYIDDPLHFDPGVFGISPREAAEMDPQQRLLLEIVWEALEDAGIPPGSLAGANIGVYVGASSLDYGNLHTADQAAIDSHFMTGNTLSILSNRISYIFDFRGPSFTIDTACSSSLVAFADAQAAIAAGRIDMAVVAGVNLLLSPTSFVGFSRASMLSPTGLCRPFSADADGYVRAEGAVAVVLCRLETALAHSHKVRAVALASDMNSDGRTNGISLPATEGQRDLLERLYVGGGIDPNRLAFIEAHGTGTRVGDPAEATAIGEALGRRRDAPLPIGSVKSNIGHLEPASGLAGLLKAVKSLENRVLPASLHLENINSAIDFAELNLAPATEIVALPPAGTWLAGISSFGFGGTNAHVIIRQAEPHESAAAKTNGHAGPAPLLLALSAHARQALSETASAYAALIEAGRDPADLASATAWQRDLAGHRLALPIAEPAQMAEILRGFAQSGETTGAALGLAPSTPPKICFAYSGNGSQWAGMGRNAFAKNAVFAAHFRAIDKIFLSLASWSLEDALHDPALADRLASTRIAQPLLFAVQSALTASLTALGLQPDFVLGHSVGEVAAAEAAGAISLDEAVRVIFHRSEQQEFLHGLGGMAAANLPVDEAEALILRSGEPGLEIAAINSPKNVTISGPADSIANFARFARKARVAVRKLDLAYPFHSAVLAQLHDPLLAALGTVVSTPGSAEFISTVTGAVEAGEGLDALYWWRNVREPVRFRAAIETAARAGATLFIEIGPRPILAGNMTDTLAEAGFHGAAIPSLIEKEGPGDPVLMVAARALALGARADFSRLFGDRPAVKQKLPSYAWQRKYFAQPHTSEALDMFGAKPAHALIGTRLVNGAPEWRSLIDLTKIPYLTDHRIDGEAVVPGTAFAEMALAVARIVFPEGPIGLEDFDLLQWLPLPQDAMRELAIRLNEDTHVVEIRSRPRLGPDEWSLHARGRIVKIASAAPAFIGRAELPHHLTASQIYDAAESTGVVYGPAFRRVLSASRNDTVLEAELSAAAFEQGASTHGQVLHPAALDSAFHALFENIKKRPGQRYAYLPVRFAALRVDQDQAIPTRARIQVDRETDQSLSICVALYDAAGAFVAGLTGGLFRAVVLDRAAPRNMFFDSQRLRLQRTAGNEDVRAVARAALADMVAATRSDTWLILEAFARALAYQSLQGLLGQTPASLEELVVTGKLSRIAVPLVQALVSHLRNAGLATEDSGTWTLARSSSLPPAQDILHSFAADAPGAAAEIVLAAQAMEGLPDFIATGTPVQIRSSVQEQFDVAACLFEPVLQSAVSLCKTFHAKLAGETLRILVAEPGSLGLLQKLLPLAHDGVIDITVIGVESKQLNLVAARIGSAHGLSFLPVGNDENIAPDAEFDLALCLAGGPLFDGEASLGRAIARRLAPAAPCAVLLPPENPVFDVLLGTREDWFAGTLHADFPVGRLGNPRDASQLLGACGFRDIESVGLGDGTGSIILAAPGSRDAAPAVTPSHVLSIGNSPLCEAVLENLRSAGHHKCAACASPADLAAEWPDIFAALPADANADIIYAPLQAEPKTLDKALGDLAAILDVLKSGKCRLWIFLRGLGSDTARTTDPIAEALWCFARVAMNEFPGIDLRLVDIDPALNVEAAAACLAKRIENPGAETEILLDGEGVSALRMAPVAQAKAAESVRLCARPQGALADFDWAETDRRAPGSGEIEIRIEAAGLNFRDVMLANGLLDDDVLDDGLAGAVLGFECAGTVLRTGPDVTDFSIGDAVMGFARESFASHSTADARVFTPVPDGISLHQAATIPVAFLTAWYALVHQARIQPGEWVLIHGAAGGVGLAAIQIARLHGARVAATVGSADKRALVGMFGAEKIFNSRSTAFHDEIAADIGGVDVVLNSLAGDAMLASVKCLKPFGRFVELGKRDYVLNTALGLRPFRRNLTYYGVDLDQLLAANLPLANRLMAEMMQHFSTGALHPLPYRAFDWFEAGKAFKLMQSAGHVGKILITPAAAPVATIAKPARFHCGEGAHIVAGGTSGFGFEAALWLADRGAKTIVLGSRSGELAPHLEPRAAALRAAGTRLLVEKLDVTDAHAVQALIGALRKRHGRVAGIMHTAMVLDDGLIASMQPARTRKVLAPKMDGAINLDLATRDAKLDYFVAFSSVTTMIGNPGQGAYVAANGFLQGLMRQRRAIGLPGLAIGWGAIADAGVLTRDPDVAERLERVSGIIPMQAADALSHLDHLLCHPHATDSTVHCAAFRAGSALQGLKLLQTPTFAGLFAAAEASALTEEIDIATQIAGKSEGEARQIVAFLVATEVARIFRLPPEEIEFSRPLDELGMDSMMSIDLRMGVEKRFGVELPVVAISAGISVNDLAARLIAGLRSGQAPQTDGDAERHLLQMHGSGTEKLDELMAITSAAKERDVAVSLL
jgi:acyl transferase domain-containing protein/NADPH:quinone reductase-like Zn-dependent oxidoreductase/acyl carrier protein